MFCILLQKIRSHHNRLLTAQSGKVMYSQKLVQALSEADPGRFDYGKARAVSRRVLVGVPDNSRWLRFEVLVDHRRIDKMARKLNTSSEILQ